MSNICYGPTACSLLLMKFILFGEMIEKKMYTETIEVKQKIGMWNIMTDFQ